MFKVQKDAIGRYRISIGVGKIYSTRDIEEVKIALAHYYGGSSCRLGNNPDCPLCQAINEEMAAMAKGKSWRTAGTKINNLPAQL